jgi:hypothetical protein
MIKSSNLTENFIETVKNNNIKSINFYLKKSDRNFKRKIIEKIQNRYNHFFKNNENKDPPLSRNISRCK